ncbi:hypothetical protein NLJ89_g7355 [Agrocybe chaxingu]|uniref:Zn(2)-C6 fungal-type domain-containing protein n=1 Tax=Agrocybe chaxingu TaxID=84603 RepID=A0A9W8JZA5_9AGAR|nr:hypothetical protein NLJ89_g7355 [Agrocybe chaxingu]
MPSQIPNTKLFQFTAEDDAESVDMSDDTDVRRRSRAQAGKPSGACVDCKSVKVRCEFEPGEKKCRRCQTKNLPCHPRERKKRKPADTHEQLQERSHEQDIHIRNLLHQYDQLRAEQKIHQWMSRAPPLRNDAMNLQQHIKWFHKGKTPEVAVISYFSTGPGPQQLVPPEMVKHCALYPEDIIELFSIFFTRVNPYFSILDKDYHTPQKLIWSSPFLFTVVCAVASRYYTDRPELYQLAMEFARDFAGKALVEGYRSVDVCQAYLIMAVYPVPKKKWAEDRSWLLMGVAIRMAIELELNQPAPPTCDERESLNRTRTWLNCYCVDGSHAIQFGKMPMLRLDDYLARNSRDWYRSSPLNTPFDVHLCAYVQMILHMAKWRAYIHADDPTARPLESEEIISAALTTQETLSREMDAWGEIYATEFSFLPLPICGYRGNTTQMITSYLRLVVLLVGFQRTKQEDLRQDSEVLVKSIEVARTTIQILVERLYPTGYLRYAMEAHFLFVSFAAAFLINLFRPRFVDLLDDHLQRGIIISVTRLITILGSNDVALDGRHTPALYSRFLSSLMARHNLSLDNFGPSGGDDSNSRPSNTQDRYTTPPDGFYWPDVPSIPDKSSDGSSEFSGGFGGYQLQGEIEMDFSLSHFIKIVTSQPTPPPPQPPVDLTQTWDTWDLNATIPQQPAWIEPVPIPATWRVV